MKRNLNKIYEHLWQGVAGKIEEGETSSEAAIRELKEETGLSPVNMFVADHVSKFYEVHGDRINLVPVFGIEVDSETINLSEEHISPCPSVVHPGVLARGKNQRTTFFPKKSLMEILSPF